MIRHQVVVNARFRIRPVTGVERYGTELLRRFGYRVRTVAPRVGARGLVGHAWEQVVLPRLVGRSDVLWSPANTGPLTVRRQIVTLHDVSVIDHPEWFNAAFARWYRYLLPRLARRVDKIITVSAFSKHRIVEVLGAREEDVVSIPNGVDATFRPIPEADGRRVRERLRLPARYVLAVGSLEPRKNLRTLFKAWDRVRHHDDVHLVVAGAEGRTFRGGGFDQPPPATTLLGHVADDDLPAVYGGAVACVMPSLYEGFGLAALEAMACGTPVIASDLTAIPEVVGHAGILVDPADPDAFPGALERVLGDAELRATLRSRGLARAQLFSWDRTAAATWDVLQNASR